MNAVVGGRHAGIEQRVLFAVWVVAAALGLLFAADAGASDGKTRFYVSPAGHDKWPGTKSRPFASIARAQRAVRAVTPRMRSDVVVVLRAGTHTLSVPLRLSDAKGDSGERGHRVIYQPYGYGTRRQERVVISGGRRIGGWRPVGGGSAAWRADAGELDTRHLFVDGERASWASLGAGIPGNVTTTSTGYVTDSMAPQAWQNPRDIEFVYTGAFPWSEPRCGVAEISGDAQSTTITMEQPCFDWSQRLFARERGGVLVPLIDPTDVQNSPSFLSKPGTFYLDRSRAGRHSLYYVPRPGEDMRRVEAIAPALETLVESRGGPGNRLHDVTFRGVNFSHATWLAPGKPTGFVHYWAHTYYNGGEVDMSTGDFPTNEDLLSVPGNLVFHGADRIRFEDNRFTKLGAAALEFSHDSGEATVIGNVFTDISAGGVQIGASAPEVGGSNPDNRVENNWVHAIGVEYLGSAGILVQGTQNTVVAHNQVNDVPYSGIVLAHSGDLENVGPRTSGQKALNNHVFDVLQRLSDGGGIYIAGPQGTSYQDGALVRGNLVHDAPFIGIYTDFFAEWDTIQDNVSYRTAYSSGGYCPVRVRLQGNFWDNEQVAYADECPPPWPEVTYSDNTLLPEGGAAEACDAISRCAAIVSNSGLEPPYRRLLDHQD